MREDNSYQLRGNDQPRCGYSFTFYITHLNYKGCCLICFALATLRLKKKIKQQFATIH